VAGLLWALAGCAQQREISALRRDSLDQVLGIVQQGGAEDQGDGQQDGDDDHNLQGTKPRLSG